MRQAYVGIGGRTANCHRGISITDREVEGRADDKRRDKGVDGHPTEGWPATTPKASQCELIDQRWKIQHTINTATNVSMVPARKMARYHTINVPVNTSSSIFVLGGLWCGIWPSFCRVPIDTFVGVFIVCSVFCLLLCDADNSAAVAVHELVLRLISGHPLIGCPSTSLSRCLSSARSSISVTVMLIPRRQLLSMSSHWDAYGVISGHPSILRSSAHLHLCRDVHRLFGLPSSCR